MCDLTPLCRRHFSATRLFGLNWCGRLVILSVSFLMVLSIGAAAAPSQDETDGVEPSGLVDSETRPIGDADDVLTEAEVALDAAGEPGFQADPIRVTIALVIVIALIVVAAMTTRLVTRRSGSLMAALGPAGSAPAGVLSVLGRYPVGRGHTLVLLSCAGRVLLISQSANRRTGVNMQTLTEFTDPVEVRDLLDKTSAADSARQFSTLMQRVSQRDEDLIAESISDADVSQSAASDPAERLRAAYAPVAVSGKTRLQDRLNRAREFDGVSG